MSEKQFLRSQNGSPPEDDLKKNGYRLIAGVDEAGRGPLAGPVVAAAVILRQRHSFTGVLDSKQLRPRQRDEILERILGEAVSVGIGIIDQWEIDRINILRASLKAMEAAVIHLEQAPDFLLIDGIYSIGLSLPQQAVKHGDSLSYVIGAASVVAKVVRDRIMEQYDRVYPRYNFLKNKGYGTRDHREAIQKYGYCSLHRKTFRGVTTAQKDLF